MRRLVLYGLIIFQIGLIVSLVRGIQLSRRSAGRIASMQETKAKLETEKDRLQKEGEYVKSDYYLEKVARDELHMAKPGETVVMIPESQIMEGINETASLEVVEKPNWQKWLGVLLGED